MFSTYWRGRTDGSSDWLEKKPSKTFQKPDPRLPATTDQYNCLNPEPPICLIYSGFYATKPGQATGPEMSRVIQQASHVFVCAVRVTQRLSSGKPGICGPTHTSMTSETWDPPVLFCCRILCNRFYFCQPLWLTVLQQKGTQSEQ